MKVAHGELRLHLPDELEGLFVEDQNAAALPGGLLRIVGADRLILTAHIDAAVVSAYSVVQPSSGMDDGETMTFGE